MELVRGIQNDDRFDVRLCVLGTRPEELPVWPNDPLEFLNAPVHQRTTFCRRWLSLRRILHHWQPHLIHSQLWPTVLNVGLVIPRSLPHLIHIYDTPPSLQSQRWGAKLRRTLLRGIASNPQVRFASVSCAATEYTSDALQLDPSRLHTIVNGVQLDRFLDIPPLQPDPDRPLVISCAGRLVADKGFDLLLRAVAFIKPHPDKLILRIAGIGSGEASLRTLTHQLGIAEHVQFLGQVSDMPGFFAGSDIFVHASVAAEGLARVLIESHAAGRPVVVTEHAGAREIVADGITGIVVPQSDPESLATAIESLMVAPNLRLTMGAEARRSAATRFSVTRVIAEVSSLYAEMLGESPR